MLNKKYRINKKYDYDYIFKNGKRVSGKYIIVFIKTNELQHSRFGIVCSKKVGNAVIRNRSKRLMRAILHHNMDVFVKNYNMVIVCRVSIKDAQYKQVEDDFLSVVRRARIL
ncbi:MAG: ribonuclease P protein component [Bacillota bacterium]|nr:ribonuclease P protein component [Bacillota bacterium]